MIETAAHSWTIAQPRAGDVLYVYQDLPEGGNPVGADGQPVWRVGRYHASNPISAVKLWHLGHWPTPLVYGYSIERPPERQGAYLRWTIRYWKGAPDDPTTPHP